MQRNVTKNQQQNGVGAAHFEPLEGRAMMSVGGPASFVYVESNNPNPGQNAVLAYRENPATGALTALPQGRFLTGGTGNLNATAALGPDDSDKEVVATADGRFLFAVNQGSNTVSVFSVNPDGSLDIIPGAPFASGGTQPVSLSISNDRLYVVNRGNGAEGTPATVAPNVTAFTIGEDGQLFAVPNSTVTLPLNLSTSQVLTSADGRFAFLDNFATPSNLKVNLANTIESFAIGNTGTLSAVSKGTATVPSSPPLVLGLVEDPANHIIYSGLPATGGIATFTYNAAGQVSYVGTTASQGAATCWLAISPNGKYLYATNSLSDTVSVFSRQNPLKPTLVQVFSLNGPSVKPGTTSATPTSWDFQLAFDASGQHLFVVNHTTDASFQQGNQLHSLTVAANGTLSESGTSPVFFNPAYVPGADHVQGIAVVTPPAANPFAWPSSPFTTNAQAAQLLASLFADGNNEQTLAELFASLLG